MQIHEKKASRKTGKVDLSTKAINSAVTRQSVEHPTVLYTAAAGVLGIAAALLLDFGLVGWLVGVGGLIASFLSFGINRGFRREQIASEYIDELFTQLEKKRKDYTQTLKKSLKELDAKEGELQYERLANKFETFNNMLRGKLKPGELTFSRYNAMAEQVYLGALDNLNDMVNTMRGIKSIDERFIKSRLKEISNPKGDDSTLTEVNALKSRLDLLQKQQDKVNYYLSQNEEAMTRMDEAIAAIADLKTEDMRADVDLELAMKHLQEIANRAQEYN